MAQNSRIHPPFRASRLTPRRGAGIFQASPLSAFLRLPLSWYHSTTFSFFPDETSAAIHRVYTPPAQEHSKRHFCGFCGTPLSYWSEEPRSEADYIHVTLGSLSSEDLGDLEELGLLPDPEDKPASPAAPSSEAGGDAAPAGRETLSLPWFDSMVAGSQLGKIRTSKGTSQSRDGKVTVEWEVVEWTADDHEADQPSPAKRSRQDATADAPSAMEDVQH